jgi:hypothetical protein
MCTFIATTSVTTSVSCSRTCCLQHWIVNLPPHPTQVKWKLQLEYPCCNYVQHVWRYIVTKFKYSCSNCVSSLQPRQWPRVYVAHKRLDFNIPSWNTTTNVTCSDFDCVYCEFWLQYTVKCVFYYGFLLQWTVKCVVLPIVIWIVTFCILICDCGFFYFVLWNRKCCLFRVLIVGIAIVYCDTLTEVFSVFFPHF